MRYQYFVAWDDGIGGVWRLTRKTPNAGSSWQEVEARIFAEPSPEPGKIANRKSKIPQSPLRSHYKAYLIFVKILVQNCLNHLYLRDLTDWVPNPSEARTFASTENAVMFCTEHQLRAVQVVLKFDHDRYDISLPASKECERPEAAKPIKP